jgi:energy-coupling factor transport system substrate-specific component
LAKAKLTIKEIALFGMLGALTFGAKVAMSGLANIEPVSLLIMVYAVVLGRKCIYPMYLYVAMEILLYGLGTWNVMYLYIWAILALGAWLMRRVHNPIAWALLSGSFGLCFGALCAPVDFFIGDIGFVVSKWISGIPFDIAHCGGNFVIALVLFVPVRRLLGKLYAGIRK